MTDVHNWALVTGASSGMGADFARQLAERGYNVIVTARRVENLDALAESIRQTHKREVRVFPADLTVEAHRLALADAAKSLSVDVAIINAGAGLLGQFDGIEWTKELIALELNIVALVHLSRLIGSQLKAKKRGFMLMTASVGGFLPTPLLASYTAGKSFVMNYGLAVREELRGTGVSLTVFSPGYTATEFFEHSGQLGNMGSFGKMTMMASDKAVRIGLRGLFARRKLVVPGFLNRFSVASLRLVSRGLAAKMAYNMVKN